MIGHSWEMGQAETARRALEDVCSGRELDRVGEVYHPQFVDHVNALEYRGLHGARKSVAVTGTHRGRHVRVWGIVISRFQDGKIVEDWAASDTLTLARQLGLWRSLRLAVKHRKLLRNPAAR